MISFTDPSFDTISQSAHFFSAAFVVLLFHGHWVAGMAVVIACATKEFWYDYKYESAQVRGSSARDFFFYMLGAAVGWGSSWL